MERLSPTAVATAYAGFSDLECARVATLVSHGIPRADAVSVVKVQHDARLASRPATRVKVISRQRVRQTATDRLDRHGMPLIRPVRREGFHRAYAVQAVHA